MNKYFTNLSCLCLIEYLRYKTIIVFLQEMGTQIKTFDLVSCTRLILIVVDGVSH